MPRLSIVIPVKNEEEHLPRLLQTIVDQTFKDVEIIVADAESTDRTVAIAESFGARVVEGGMPGPGRNKGALHATGDVIAFFDADVQLPNATFLEACLAEMNEKGLDVATCKVRPISVSHIDHALHEAYNAYAIAMEQLRPHAPGFCIFVRRHAHTGIKGFDEDVVFAEDHDYVQRAAKAGHRFGVLRSHPIAVSIRRLEKDGRISIALKYLYGELRMMVKGPIKELPFDYEMGGSEDGQKTTKDE